MRAISTLPNVTVEMDGMPLALESIQTLETVRVQQRLSLPSQCELIFLEPPQALVDLLVPGADLKVDLSGFQDTLFEGQVTAVEYSYSGSGTFLLHVRGYDALHGLRTHQSGRVHIEVTPLSLAQELTADLGITVEAAEPGPRYPRLIHDYQTDFDLLRSILDRCGLYMTMRGSTLHLVTLEGLDGPLALALGETLLEASVDVNAGFASAGISVMGWDALGVEAYSVTASEARSGRRIQADTSFSLLMEQDRDVVNAVAHDQAEAQARAQAELDARIAGSAILRGVAEGDPALMPGARIDVSGLAETVNGQYVLTGVTHLLDHRHGFVSELSTEPPAPSRRPIGSNVTLGTVIAVDDPDGLGRVRVSLPAYDDAETEWLGVLSLGAGADKGLIVLPNTDDSVLVLLANENPGQGIVLGGLYGGQGAPEPGVENGEVRAYTLMTRGGQRIQLQETPDSIVLKNEHDSRVELTADTIRLENGDGSSLEFTPEHVHLTSMRDLVLEAPGKSMTLRANRIDLEQG